MRSSDKPGEGVQGVHSLSHRPTDNLLLKIYASQCRVEDQLGKLADDQLHMIVQQEELALAIASITESAQNLRSTSRSGSISLRNPGKRHCGRSTYKIDEAVDRVTRKTLSSCEKVDRKLPRLTDRWSITSVVSQQSDGDRCTVSTTSGRNSSCVFDSELYLASSIKQTYLNAITIRKELEVMPPKPHGRASVQELIVNRALGTAEHLKFELEIDDDKRCTIPLDPHGRIPLIFNLIGLIVLLHDLVVTPFMIAWDLEVKGGLLVLAWCACVFWAFDSIMSFITGYYTQGELCLNFRRIARHYMQTWFAVDIVLITVDWFTSVMSSSNDINSKFLQTARLIRFLKVFRVIKLIRLLEKMSCWDLSLSSQLMIQGVKVVLVTLIVTHIWCCLWYMLGRSTSDPKNWLSVAFVDSDDVKYRYITSWQWTVAQVTLGATDVSAQNHTERAFNSFLLIFGMLFGTAVVSSFSAQIVEIIMLARDFTQKVETLRRYLRQRNIPQTLAIKIHNQALERHRKDNPLREEDVSLLVSLAPMLRRELVKSTRMPYLLRLPLFRLWADIDKWNLQQLCHEATEIVFLSPSDDLFVAGTSAGEAYCVMSGNLLYQQDPETSWVDEHVTESYGPHSWLCEAALWCEWVHVGSLRSLTSSEIIAVKAKTFFEVVAKSDPIHYLLKSYGNNFYLRVIASVPPHAPWPSDARVPFTELSELMAADIGVGLLRLARSTFQLKLSHELEMELVDELSCGKCALQKMEDGTLQRCIAVVALELAGPDGKILYQVGRRGAHGSHIKTDCILPGTKRAMSELPSVALERLLVGDLGPFAGMITLRSVREVVESKLSPKYGMHTKYSRTVHAACMDQCCKAAAAPMGTAMTQDTGNGKMIPVTTVYSIMDHNQRQTLYAWLTHEDLKLLSGPEQEQVFDQWMKSLEWSHDAGENADLELCQEATPSQVRRSCISASAGVAPVKQDVQLEQAPRKVLPQRGIDCTQTPLHSLPAKYHSRGRQII